MEDVRSEAKENPSRPAEKIKPAPRQQPSLSYSSSASCCVVPGSSEGRRLRQHDGERGHPIPRCLPSPPSARSPSPAAALTPSVVARRVTQAEVEEEQRTEYFLLRAPLGWADTTTTAAPGAITLHEAPSPVRYGTRGVVASLPVAPPSRVPSPVPPNPPSTEERSEALSLHAGACMDGSSTSPSAGASPSKHFLFATPVKGPSGTAYARSSASQQRSRHLRELSSLSSAPNTPTRGTLAPSLSPSNGADTDAALACDGPPVNSLVSGEESRTPPAAVDSLFSSTPSKEPFTTHTLAREHLLQQWKDYYVEWFRFLQYDLQEREEEVEKLARTLFPKEEEVVNMSGERHASEGLRNGTLGKALPSEHHQTSASRFSCRLPSEEAMARLAYLEKHYLRPPAPPPLFATPLPSPTDHAEGGDAACSLRDAPPLPSLYERFQGPMEEQRTYYTLRLREAERATEALQFQLRTQRTTVRRTLEYQRNQLTQLTLMEDLLTEKQAECQKLDERKRGLALQLNRIVKAKIQREAEEEEAVRNARLPPRAAAVTPPAPEPGSSAVVVRESEDAVSRDTGSADSVVRGDEEEEEEEEVHQEKEEEEEEELSQRHPTNAAPQSGLQAPMNGLLPLLKLEALDGTGALPWKAEEERSESIAVEEQDEEDEERWGSGETTSNNSSPSRTQKGTKTAKKTQKATKHKNAKAKARKSAAPIGTEKKKDSFLSDAVPPLREEDVRAEGGERQPTNAAQQKDSVTPPSKKTSKSSKKTTKRSAKSHRPSHVLEEEEEEPCGFPDFLQGYLLPELERLWADCIQLPECAAPQTRKKPGVPPKNVVTKKKKKKSCEGEEDTEDGVEGRPAASFSQRPHALHTMEEELLLHARRTEGGGISGRAMEEVGWAAVHRVLWLVRWDRYPYYSFYGGATEDHLKSKPLHTFLKCLRQVGGEAFRAEERYRLQLTGSLSAQSTSKRLNLSSESSAVSGSSSPVSGFFHYFPDAKALEAADFTAALKELDAEIWEKELYGPWRRRAEALLQRQCQLLEHVLLLRPPAAALLHRNPSPGSRLPEKEHEQTEGGVTSLPPYVKSHISQGGVDRVQLEWYGSCPVAALPTSSLFEDQPTIEGGAGEAGTPEPHRRQRHSIGRHPNKEVDRTNSSCTLVRHLLRCRLQEPKLVRSPPPHVTLTPSSEGETGSGTADEVRGVTFSQHVVHPSTSIVLHHPGAHQALVEGLALLRQQCWVAQEPPHRECGSTTTTSSPGHQDGEDTKEAVSSPHVREENTIDTDPSLTERREDHRSSAVLLPIPFNFPPPASSSGRLAPLSPNESAPAAAASAMTVKDFMEHHLVQCAVAYLPSAFDARAAIRQAEMAAALEQRALQEELAQVLEDVFHLEKQLQSLVETEDPEAR